MFKRLVCTLAFLTLITGVGVKTVLAQTTINVFRDTVACGGVFYYISEEYLPTEDQGMTLISRTDTPATIGSATLQTGGNREMPTAEFSSNLGCLNDTELVFAGTPTGQPYGLYSLDLATYELTKLTDLDDTVQELTVNPDGIIGYRSNGPVWEYNPTTGKTQRKTNQEVRVVEGPMYPATGTAWAYTDYDVSPAWRIKVMTGNTTLTLPEYSQFGRFCSPTTFVYELNRDIYIINLNTPNAEPVNLTNGEFLFVGAPSCSADSKHISFAASKIASSTENGVTATPPKVYTIDPNGKNLTPIGDGGTGEAPVWLSNDLSYFSDTQTGTVMSIVHIQ